LVLVNGKEERHPEGAYYLEWRERTKRVRLSVGKDPVDASARRLRKEAELNAVNHGVTVRPEDGQNGHRSVAAAIADFLDETKLTKKPKTLAAYSTALAYFQESCPKVYLGDIERGDLLKFSAFLRDEKEQSPRSVYNKFENLMTFLKAHGIRGLVGKNDWPRYVEEEPEIYEREELNRLFAACDAQEQRWYEFFLMTGMREQEVMHCSWEDINLTRSTVTVRYKPEYGFSPKNYREREIPIPQKLVKKLKAAKAGKVSRTRTVPISLDRQALQRASTGGVFVHHDPGDRLRAGLRERLANQRTDAARLNEQLSKAQLDALRRQMRAALSVQYAQCHRWPGTREPKRCGREHDCEAERLFAPGGGGFRSATGAAGRGIGVCRKVSGHSEGAIC